MRMGSAAVSGSSVVIGRASWPALNWLIELGHQDTKHWRGRSRANNTVQHRPTEDRPGPSAVSVPLDPHADLLLRIRRSRVPPCVIYPCEPGFAVGLPRKVVGGYLDWLTTGMPFFTGLGVPSYQFLFLGVHTDHRVTAGEELRGEGVEVPELGVPVGVLVPFQGLAGGL